MDGLPDDAITKILSRLEIRWVFRCRSVCKTWCSVIDNPAFRQMHLASTSVANRNPPFSSSVIVSHDGSMYVIKDDAATEAAFGAPSISAIDFPPSYPSSFELLSSVKGLLLLACSEIYAISVSPNIRIYSDPSQTLYICNPATFEYAQLPNTGFVFPEKYKKYAVLSTLGFDDSSKKFKVLSICSRWNDEEVNLSVEAPVEARVHTLGSNSWRRTQGNLPVVFNLSSPSVFTNNSVHWICPELDEYGSPYGEQPFHIVSFDMEHEGFGLIPFPGSESGLNTFTIRLGELEGCLCLSDCSSNADHCEIWLLKDYNVKDSWTKQFVITIEQQFFIYPLCYRRNGELVVVRDESGRRLYAYNLETGSCAPLGDEESTSSCLISPLTAYPYVASLISPKVLCEIEGNKS